jgi:hypothetical protein
MFSEKGQENKSRKSDSLFQVKAYNIMQPIFNADCTVEKKKTEQWKKLHDDEFQG